MMTRISPSTQLLTASWDTSIRLWSLAPPADDEESVSVDVMTTGANANVPAQKKRRAMPASTSLVVRKPLATMNGHAGPVSCVVFDRQMTGASDAAIVAPTTFYSGSWDHTVRVWDLEAHVFVKSIVSVG